MYDKKNPPTDGEIASLLRQIGTIEEYDTELKYGDKVFLLADDGTVTCNGVDLGKARADLGKTRS